jgi:hypothetical protein
MMQYDVVITCGQLGAFLPLCMALLLLLLAFWNCLGQSSNHCIRIARMLVGGYVL